MEYTVVIWWHANTASLAIVKFQAYMVCLPTLLGKTASSFPDPFDVHIARTPLSSLTTTTTTTTTMIEEGLPSLSFMLSLHNCTNLLQGARSSPAFPAFAVSPLGVKLRLGSSW